MEVREGARAVGEGAAKVCPASEPSRMCALHAPSWPRSPRPSHAAAQAALARVRRLAPHASRDERHATEARRRRCRATHLVAGVDEDANAVSQKVRQLLLVVFHPVALEERVDSHVAILPSAVRLVHAEVAEDLRPAEVLADAREVVAEARHFARDPHVVPGCGEGSTAARRGHAYAARDGGRHVRRGARRSGATRPCVGEERADALVHIQSGRLIRHDHRQVAARLRRDARDVAERRVGDVAGADRVDAHRRRDAHGERGEGPDGRGVAVGRDGHLRVVRVLHLGVGQPVPDPDRLERDRLRLHPLVACGSAPRAPRAGRAMSEPRARRGERARCWRASRCAC